MPKVNPQLPQTPDNPWKDLQFRFDGRWIPDVDPSLIGPNNYAKIENLRYKDSGLEGVNGYTKVNTDPMDGTAPYVALGDFPLIRNGHQLRSDRTQKTYVLTHNQNDIDQGRVFVNRTDIGSQGAFDTTSRFDINGNPYYEDSATDLVGRFSGAPRGNLSYSNGQESMIFGGDEQHVSALFACTDDGGSSPWNPSNPIEYTDEVNNNITTDSVTFATGAGDNLVLMTTRPIQGIKFYLTGTPVGGTVSMKYWAGDQWTAVANPTDGTTGMTVSGSYTFDHTKSVVKLKHYEELYLYAYLITLTGAGASADIYSMTVDTAFQNIVNVWDGVYRQPVQVQVANTNTAKYADYTAHANVPSEEDNPVGMKLTEFKSTGNIVLMFTEKQAGIRMQMLGSLVNEQAAPTLTLKYWNGTAYSGVATQVDGSSAFSETGLISWIPNASEKPRTLFDTFGYAYEITLDKDVVPPTSSETYVDIVTGVPSQIPMKSYDFTSHYGTRVMQCAPSVLNEGNRIDFSVANAPDVYNGDDSSDDGQMSLYFGGSQNITASAGLYNRFGSNILSMFLVLKDAETYLLIGDNPDEFTIYPVSRTIGCPAPLTLATGEINMSKNPTEGITRNIAVWMSASGPVMFDGASISSIRGMENFFDPNNDEYIEWDVVSRARGWMDNVYKEYNLLLPSSTGQTENNRWLVYDLLRRKWYEKRTGTALIPQAAWEVIDTTGERFNYGGIDSGYMLYLENGTNWGGVGITQRLKTGDFFPSSNIWDETTIRKFKLLTHKFEDVVDTNTLNIYYYKNTEETIGSGVSYIDTDSGITGVNVNFLDTTHVVWAATSTVSIDVNEDIGTRRVINIVTDENRMGWAHAYEFVITTTDVKRGFRPIAWGVRYRVERKDDQATQ